MKDKLISAIKQFEREYDAKLDEFQIERIVNLCLNDLACHPSLEKQLIDIQDIRFFVIQTILNDISRSEVKKLC